MATAGSDDNNQEMGSTARLPGKFERFDLIEPDTEEPLDDDRPKSQHLTGNSIRIAGHEGARPAVLHKR